MPKGVYRRTEEHKKNWFKEGHTLNQGEKNINWKGNEAGYSALHGWIDRNFIKTEVCDDCSLNPSKTKNGKAKIHWANVSGRYLRIRSDWQCLCYLCHKKFDYASIPRGEQQGNSKLTEKEVLEIRETAKSGNYPKLARIFNVTSSNIGDIVRRRSWKHI